MATASTTVDTTAYVLLTSLDSLVQNVSAYPIRVVFSTTLPSASTTDYFTLNPGAAILKTGNLPADSVYVRAEKAGNTSKVVYST